LYCLSFFWLPLWNPQTLEKGQTIQWSKEKGQTIQWSKEKGQTIQWSKEKGETIQWSKEKGQTIQWSKEKGQTIQWSKPFSFDHCIVCPFLLTIVLSVLFLVTSLESPNVSCVIELDCYRVGMM
jgi:hypothetical protein